MLIRYMGFRSRHRDVLYRTGEWRKREVKNVPDAFGAKLLRHPDMFVRVADDYEAEVGKVETVDMPQEQTPDAEAARAQEARDIVNAMTDKQSVADFALANWQRKLNQRQSLDKLKSEAIMLIDQYGLP